MGRVVRHFFALILFSGSFLLAATAYGLADRPPAPEPSPSRWRLELPQRPGLLIPDAAEEIVFEGYGVQAASPVRFFPKARRRPALHALELLMRQGDLLDSLVEAPVLHFGHSATLFGPDGIGTGSTGEPPEVRALEALLDESILPAGPGTAQGASRSSVVPEPRTGALVSCGLLTLGLASRRRIVEPAKTFLKP